MESSSVFNKINFSQNAYIERDCESYSLKISKFSKKTMPD